MLYCPLDAKTWVGRLEIFSPSLFGLLCFFLKPTVDFKIFGSVAKGNTTFFKGLMEPPARLKN